VETGCQGGQGSPRAVAPGGWMEVKSILYKEMLSFHVVMLVIAMFCFSMTAVVKCGVI
jgi:hypothetical protein